MATREDRASWLSARLFVWPAEVVAKGFRKPLEHSDLDPMSIGNSVEECTERFEKQLAITRTQGGSLWTVFARMNLRTVLLAGFCKLMSVKSALRAADCFIVAAAICLRSLVRSAWYTSLELPALSVKFLLFGSGRAGGVHL